MASKNVETIISKITENDVNNFAFKFATCFVSWDFVSSNVNNDMAWRGTSKSLFGPQTLKKNPLESQKAQSKKWLTTEQHE